MNINSIKSYNSAFKSNIRIVNPKEFNVVNFTLSRNGGVDDIYNFRLKDETHYSKCYRVNAENISTEGIRSCTGGLIINENNKKANLAMHVYDDEMNYSKLSVFDEFLKGTNAFLIGSRNQYEYSPKIFNNFVDKLEKRNIPTTIFEDLQGLWEAAFTYISNKDEIVVCIKDVLNPKKYVKNMEELEQAFRKVVISAKDKISFSDLKLSPIRR